MKFCESLKMIVLCYWKSQISNVWNFLYDVVLCVTSGPESLSEMLSFSRKMVCMDLCSGSCPVSAQFLSTLLFFFPSFCLGKAGIREDFPPKVVVWWCFYPLELRRRWSPRIIPTQKVLLCPAAGWREETQLPVSICQCSQDGKLAKSIEESSGVQILTVQTQFRFWATKVTTLQNPSFRKESKECPMCYI